MEPTLPYLSKKKLPAARGSVNGNATSASADPARVDGRGTAGLRLPWLQAYSLRTQTRVLLGVLALHALRGWQLSPLGPRALLDLLRVPFFVLWKLYVLLRNRRNKHWIKTDRDSK